MRKGKLYLLAAGICLLAGACGSAGDSVAVTEDSAAKSVDRQSTETEAVERRDTDELDDARQWKAEDAKKPDEAEADARQESREPEDSALAASSSKAERGAVISDQSFDVQLAPLGDVRFVSYAPGAASEDAVFAVEKDGEELFVLDGMQDGNVRTTDTFEQVEAVSFPDYNGDGNDDIILICRYRPNDGTDTFSEVRLYEGTASGRFLFRKELSEETASALSELTIGSVKGFLGADRKSPEEVNSVQRSWQQAYIDHIREHENVNSGYTLIYLDDDEIPELAEIGDCEASGCRIVVYSDGALKETQLYRLHFSYIERENLLCNSDGHMGVYYDYVYQIRDGELVMTEKGDYGASGDDKMQFDEDGEPVYEYYWNNEQMTKEAYGQALHAAYDETKAREGYQWGEYDSAEEMIHRLEGL